MGRSTGVVIAASVVACALPAHAEETVIAPAPAEHRWVAPTWQEWALLGVAESLIAVDVLQTLDMTRRPREDFRETNPLLGSHPSAPRILASGAGAAAATALLFYALKPGVRAMVPGLIICAEAPIVFWNARAGLTIRF